MTFAREFTIGVICIALGTTMVKASNSASQEATGYEAWIHSFRQGPLRTDDGTIRTLGADDGIRPIVVITAVEGDDLKPDERTAEAFGSNYRISSHGCSVSSEGKISFFYHRFNDSRGGGYPVISKNDLERMKTLLAKLPDDHEHLPPAGRRLVLQVPSGNDVLARVYDRANLPEDVTEILRLSDSGINSWALKIDPKSQWKVIGGDGTFAPSPGGREIVIARDDSISVWDADSHAMIRSAPYSFIPDRRTNGTLTPTPPNHLIFSPDGLTAIIGDPGDLDVRDARTWEGLRKLRQDPREPRLVHPQFSPDGRYLFAESERFLGSRWLADESALLIFDTKTWERHALLSQIPMDAIAYFPSKNGKRALYLSKKGAIKLWDPNRRRDLAELDDNGRIIDASFSPDQTLFAVVIAHDNVQGSMSFVRDSRIAVWRADNGTLVHELHPFEQSGYFAGDLHWWPNSKYLMATVWATAMFTERGIGVWDVKSGRFRTEFTGDCGGVGFELSPERKELMALCGTSLLVWDGADGIRQIETGPEYDPN